MFKDAWQLKRMEYNNVAKKNHDLEIEYPCFKKVEIQCVDVDMSQVM